MGTRNYNGAHVVFDLAASRRATLFVAAAAGATLALLAFLPGPVVLRGLSALWCAGIAAHALANIRRVRAVRVDGRRISVDGVPGDVVDGSFVARWLTIVHWRPLGARFTRTLLVLPDMLDPDSFRALRVILRWGKAG
jgi:hypothetical protein